MKKIYLFILIAFILGSCGNDPKENQGPGWYVMENGDTIRSKRPIEEVDTSVPEKYRYMNQALVPTMRKLDSIYDAVPYFALLGTDTLFYVATGNYEQKEYQKHIYGDFKLGIINHKQDTIVSIKYDKLYNPGVTAKGFIEVEKGHQRGLVSYDGTVEIPVIYDAIYPSPFEQYIAIGKTGKIFTMLSSSGEQVVISDSTFTPRSLIANIEFDARSSNITHLVNPFSYYYDGEPEEGNHTVYTPSYLHQFSFMPEVHRGLNTLEEENHQLGVIQSKGDIKDAPSFSDKIFTYLSSFYEEGVDGRGWSTERKYLVTTDNFNTVLDTAFVLDYDKYYGLYCDEWDFKFADSATLVVSRTKWVDEYPEYQYMTVYDIYQVREDGQIEKLNSNRMFNYTEFVDMDTSYFSGCFVNEIPDSDDPNLLVTSHLSIRDLDIMRNEIFADYGYIFKSDEWKTYFESKDWYEGKYDNVDEFLTEREKANIDLILRIKELMNDNEEEFINAEKVTFYPAG